MLALRRLCPLVACAGIAVAVGAMVVGQVLAAASHPDPLALTIGEYAAVEGSGATELAMISLAVASLALVAGLRAARAPLGRAVERLLAVWSGALTVMALVPAGAPAPRAPWTAGCPARCTVTPRRWPSSRCPSRER